MAKAELLREFVLKWEGGFSNDPDDAGGITNKGVAIETHSQSNTSFIWMCCYGFIISYVKRLGIKYSH